MITIYVAYAGNADTPFDREYWINVHLPLVRDSWGTFGLERLGGFFPQGDGGGLIAIAPCVFRGRGRHEGGVSLAGDTWIMADVDHVTAVKPQRSLAISL